MAVATASKKATKRSHNDKGFEETLWDTANKLRGSVESSEYKHVVLSLIFLKFASDKFEQRKQALIDGGQEAYLDMVDFYTAENVFYLAEESRWSYLVQHAKQDDIALKIDTALHTVEKNNKSLKGALPDNYYSRLGMQAKDLASLIDSINNIDTITDTETDVVGRVYEYFLGKFAATEGKGGGEFYTPKCVVNLIAEMIEPYKGKIYDPCCGSGGMFVQSIKFVESHHGNSKDISIYGQENTATTYKLAKMNLAIRGISGNLGDVPGNTFFKDQHPDLKADFIMANPPFNQKDWRGDNELVDDARWSGYDTPPTGNANYAWIQHMIAKLSQHGTAGFVLANGSMSTATSGEGKIRQQIIDNDLVDCMIALPGQLFYTTQIPVCLWFLSRDKQAQSAHSKERGFRNRQGETLFIDARNMGSMVNRTLKELTTDDIAHISNTYHSWRSLTPSPSNSTGEQKKTAITEDSIIPPLPLGEGRGEGRGQGEGKNTQKKSALPAQLRTFARALRAKQTDAEQLLWKLLRNRQVADTKFRRQHPIDNYILDFYSHEHKLAIELDGSQHFEEAGKAKDRLRTDYLYKQGIKVLRFDNRQMLTETEAVLEAIYNELIANVNSLTPSPSPKGRGEQKNTAITEDSIIPPLPLGEGRGESRDEGDILPTGYQDTPGYSKSATLDDIKANDYVLTPGRYVGAAPIEDDGIPFETKMTELSQTLYRQMQEAEKLDAVIRKNLEGLGYGE